MSITVNAESWQASLTVHMACAAFKMLAAQLQQTVLPVSGEWCSERSLHSMTAAKERFPALQEALLSLKQPSAA